MSAYLRGLVVVTLAILDEPGPESLRAYVERNAIALLSTVGRTLDPPSDAWLGHASPREPIRGSGLWNVNHVGETVDAAFIERFAEIASGRGDAGPPVRQQLDAGRRPSRARRADPKSAASDRGGTVVRSSRPTALEFRSALSKLLTGGVEVGLRFVDVRSGDLHRVVGGYPGPLHALSTCCSVMRSLMRDGDEELAAPPRGVGASLVIRYRLPR